jgi:hypothetical protein
VEKTNGDRRRSRADWMLSEQLFPAVIDAETWEKVQAKLAANPAKRRAPKSAQLWLAGLVHCAGCGRPMRGYTRSEQQNRYEYICSSYAEGTPGCTCQRNAVQHSVVEGYVREYLSETSQLWDDFDGTAVLKGDAADQWADLYKRCADAYMDMQRMVQGGLDNLTGLLHVNAELESGKQPAEGAALVAAYRAKLEEAQGPVRDRLKELEAEHDRITNGLMNLPPGSRAMAKMQARLTEVEAQINEVEAKLTNRADELENTRRELLKLATDWQEAAEAVNTDSSARRKAEAVRKVVAKIVLTFKPTGKRHPTSDLAFVEFITHGGDSTGSVDVTAKCPNSDLSTPCTSPPASTSTTPSRG